MMVLTIRGKTVGEKLLIIKEESCSGSCSMFPEHWTEETLEKAGKHVYTTGDEVDSNGYGRAFEGLYDGVNVRINVLTSGTIDNINPSYDQP